MEQLPPAQRGELMGRLWALSVGVTAANAVLIGSLVRIGWRVARCADRRPVPMAKAAWSPALGIAAGALAAQRVTGPIVMRRIESWLDDKTNEPDSPTT